jgi:hypothetical protein
MSTGQLAQKVSIFEKADDDRLPVKPVRTERNFGVPPRPALSATGIQSRINQLVRHESKDTSSSLLDVDNVNKADSTAEATNITAPKIDRLLDVRRHTAPLFFTSTFAPIQEWEGYVREIGTNSISADLVDITANAKVITDQAEIPLDELSDGDRQKLKIGSIFRWSIGYQRTTSGTKMRVSNIVFRELPRWTRKDIREALEEAAKLEQYFNSGRSKLPNSIERA